MDSVEDSNRHLSTISSVYSQPSPEFQGDFPQNQAASSTHYDQDSRVPSSIYTDISPPDSPDHDIHREWRGTPNISPIEEETEEEIQANLRPKSNIPILRSLQNQDGLKPINTGRVGAPTFGWKSKLSSRTGDSTKWDDYSGEPSENGKNAQVKPGTNALDQITSANKVNKLPFRFQKGPQDQERESIVERRSRLRLANSPASSAASERESEIDTSISQHVPRKPIHQAPASALNDGLTALPQREPWKGASGRSTIVNPVADNPSARTKPLTVPARPARRPVPEIHEEEEKASTAPSKPTLRTVSHDTSEMTSSADELHQEPIKPVVPLKAGRNSPPGVSPTYSTQRRAVSSPVVPSPAMKSARSPSSIYSDLNKPLPTPAETSDDQPGSTDVAAKPPTPVPDTEFQAQSQSLKMQEQPSSRFSATTYATTRHESPPGTPRMSTDVDPPPMPAIPPGSYRSQVSTTPPTKYDSPASNANTPPLSKAPSPILNRKRPVASQVDRSSINPYVYTTTPKITARKPTPSQVSRSSVYSNDGGFGPSKALPVSPPELEAPDKVTALQARLDNLQRRRQNIQVILKELTQVIQPSSVAYDLASRKEVKKTVTSLENEMADIAKEEHEVGLKLHRAWKKRDEENAWGGGGGLWVRRVTG
jgi:hypothetical protein